MNQLKRIIGLKESNSGNNDIELIDYKIAEKISLKTIFPADSDKMYYYVREGFQETNISEGFCKELTLTSEMLGGVVKIDGHTTIDISMGDRFNMVVDPDYHLRCMNLII